MFCLFKKKFKKLIKKKLIKIDSISNFYYRDIQPNFGEGVEIYFYNQKSRLRMKKYQVKTRNKS